MLTKTGRGMMPPQSIQALSLHLTGGPLAYGMTYTRADSVATARNAAGRLITVAANVPRYDYDAAGKPLGLLIEGAVQNKCTNFNANPVDTTNLVKAGDAASTLSVVDDAAALAAAGLNLVCTSGKVYRLDNSAGSTTAYVDIGGTTGNINVHSFSAWVRGNSGTVGYLTRSGTGGSTALITGGLPYQRLKLENETPSSTGGQIRVRANAGKIIWFILNQLEELPFCTSEIITAGAAATRAQDRLVLNLQGQLWFSAASGYMGVRYRPRGFIPGVYQYLAVADNGINADNTIGLRLNMDVNDIGAYVRAGAASQNGNSTADIIAATTLNACGLTWQAGQSSIISGGRTTTRSHTLDPSGITRLNIGGRTGGADPFYGHITDLLIGPGAVSVPDLGGILHQSADIAVIGGGQSLVRGYFNSNESNSSAGKLKLRQVAGVNHPDRVVTFVDGARGGSAATKTSDPVDYWWDLTNNIRGPCLQTLYNNVSAAGMIPTAILFELGETDSAYIPSLTSRAQFKAAMQAIFNDMRQSFGPVPIILQRIGRRTASTNPGGIQAVREVQQELINENPWVHDGAEVYDLTLYDSVHPNDAGFVTLGERNGRIAARIFGADLPGTDGPRLVSATRSGTTVSVTLGHDSGTDFTPPSGITGFRFFAGSTEITVNSAVRSSAATLTLTLNSAPVSGIETLYYIYDHESTLSLSGVVRDNATPSMPLRPGRVVVT